MLGFRIWDSRHNWFTHAGNFYINHEGILRAHDKSFNMEIYVPMQSTGMTDINGVEIFAGDIICFLEFGAYKMEERLMEVDGVVEFIERMAIADLSRADNRVEAKVIGNIYQNPELLKEIK